MNLANEAARSSGVLLHLTSLPGGRLGREARAFVDWLAAAGQTWWQMLPLGPPDRYRSPYKSKSAFAAWSGFLAAPRAAVSAEERISFREREAFWIEDWLRVGGRDALDDQVRFDREWSALRAYAAERGVRLMGDVAIYVAPGSADHLAHPGLFAPGAVAGAPPDAFSSVGQLWGNPLYDWPSLQRRGYRWWVERLRRTLAWFDAARLDHFRGFVAYWAVPEGDRDARRGRWRRGPGRALFDAFEREVGGGVAGVGRVGGGVGLPLVVEDLGVITPAVERLRVSLGLPGMVVLQFGFDPDEPGSLHRFANHTEDRVVYTGTHDHDTARGWYESLRTEVRARVDADMVAAGVLPAGAVARSAGASSAANGGPWWSLIELALRSRARIAVVQAQDVLGLGSEARMNDPGRARGNWRWQMVPGALTADHARRLHELTEAGGRLPARSRPGSATPPI